MTPDYKAVFEASSSLQLLLTPELRIVAASDAYVAATLTPREQMVGKLLFDVFPENPDDSAAGASTGASRLSESFDIVVRTRMPHVMDVIKYDVRVSDSDGGGFIERHWAATNSPLLGADGEVLLIINCVEDVTAQVRLEAERDRILGELRRAVDDVSTLSGLIPVCAWCKKVRDDQGFWYRVEEFIAARTDATFTHSVCADCARKVK
ncbi:MAG: PAS domain-containing protein [Acidobacteriota bacterium]|nr:PAS domain-containing protein [Acidobacteriota bacterium]